jgi:hypothetical protein
VRSSRPAEEPADKAGCAAQIGEKQRMRTWRDFYRVTHPQLRELMTGLYYPAVLGAGIVFLLLLFSHTHPLSDTLWDFRFWFGFLFSLFFSFSYFTILQAPGANYNFGTNLIEQLHTGCS